MTVRSFIIIFIFMFMVSCGVVGVKCLNDMLVSPYTYLYSENSKIIKKKKTTDICVTDYVLDEEK